MTDGINLNAIWQKKEPPAYQRSSGPGGASRNGAAPDKNKISAIVKYSHQENPTMPPNLLLVEDNSRLRHDLDAHFRQRGFAVTACATGVHSTQVSTTIE